MEHHPEGLLLEADTCSALMKTLQRDCRVLESFKIMDYSLLVGIHNLDIAAKEKAVSFLLFSSLLFILLVQLNATTQEETRLFLYKLS